MDQVRVGFIGAGGIAHRHLGVLQQFPDVRIVAASDSVLDRAQEFSGRVGANAYTDFRTMLDQEQIDAAYVCVPPFAHGEAEAALVERDIPFFVEKPLAVDMEIAQTILNAVEAKGLITGVGYHWRYMDTTEEAQRILADRPARLALGYWLDSTPPPQWWSRQDQSGGQMHEQTTHIFDLARVLVGEVDRVCAFGSTIRRPEFPDLDIFDVSTANLQFASGAVGNMASTCLLKWNHRVGLHLFGDGIAIEIGMHDIMIDIGQGRPVRGQNGDPVEREDRDFIDAVKGLENRIRTPYREAMRTHQLTIAAQTSARENRLINLKAEANEATYV